MENINNFIKEYHQLINSDEYISKNKIDELFYKYSSVFYNDLEDKRLVDIILNNTKIINTHNSNFVNKSLKENKLYFDNMFNKIDSNIFLDEEQRKIIIEDEDNTLVIAGAGSGKTTTMTAKVKYLVDKKNINPKDILILAFTNQATIELKERINNVFKINVQVMTFHKLGLQIIGNCFKSKYKIITENELEIIIEDYLLNYIFKNKNKLKNLTNNFNEYINFTRKIYKYKSFEDYYNNYIYELYYKHFYHIKKYNIKKIKENLKELKSIENDTYKNETEVLTANYLFVNNISYIFSLDEFCVFDDILDNYRIINENIYLDSNNYIKSIIKIIKTLNKNSKIKKQLNTFKSNKTDKQIFITIMKNKKQELYQEFISLVKNFIFKFKSSSIDDFNSLIDNNKNSKNKLEIIKEIYEYYNNYKKLNNMIDFDDIIDLAYQNIHKIDLKYKYIIIDEYQDISFKRYKLIQKISNIFNAKIIAVGDDFQAIYSFSGTDVNLFTNFYDLMGHASIKKITKTYRNSQQLIDIAGNFVMKNKSQFKKQLISNKSLDNPIEIVYYENNKIEMLNETLKNINKNSKILLLGRYKNDIYSIIDNIHFKKSNDKIICLKLNMELDFLTVHSSKGLGYDNVILLNFENSKFGFPSQIDDDKLIRILKNEEEFEYAEERRLFYVALTRTKNKVYIMCPKDENKRSCFYKEIIDKIKIWYF